MTSSNKRDIFSVEGVHLCNQSYKASVLNPSSLWLECIRRSCVLLLRASSLSSEAVGTGQRQRGWAVLSEQTANKQVSAA